MREVVIHSWDDLQREIFDGVWDESIMRYRTNCVYRGMSVETWGLSHSLHRACAHDLSLERQMLRSFRKYGYADLLAIACHGAAVWTAHPPAGLDLFSPGSRSFCHRGSGIVR